MKLHSINYWHTWRRILQRILHKNIQIHRVGRLTHRALFNASLILSNYLWLRAQIFFFKFQYIFPGLIQSSLGCTLAVFIGRHQQFQFFIFSEQIFHTIYCAMAAEENLHKLYIHTILIDRQRLFECLWLILRSRQENPLIHPQMKCNGCTPKILVSNHYRSLIESPSY